MLNLMVRPNRMSREIDNWFDDFLKVPGFRPETEAEFVPRVNVVENDDNLSLTFELPGMNKEEIKVTVQDATLSVSGERRFEYKDEKDHLVRREIRSGSFSRSFTLPETVDAESITADYRHGLLEIKLAKKEETKPREIDVQVK